MENNLCIYILELEHNKYYVGKTNNSEFRIEQHFNKNGAEWTKKYKPIKVVEVIPDCDDFDEDKYTLSYMNKYGINNVRGGSFCTIKLDDENIAVLKKMLRNATNKCFICGANDHFADECMTKSIIIKKEETIIKQSSSDGPCNCVMSYVSGHRKSACLLNKVIKIIYSFFDDEYDDKVIEKIKKNDNDHGNKTIINNKYKCFKCDKVGHFAKDCNLKNEYKCNYCSNTYATLKGAKYHENFYCKNKPNK